MSVYVCEKRERARDNNNVAYREGKGISDFECLADVKTEELAGQNGVERCICTVLGDFKQNLALELHRAERKL